MAPWWLVGNEKWTLSSVLGVSGSGHAGMEKRSGSHNLATEGSGVRVKGAGMTHTTWKQPCSGLGFRDFQK